LNSIAKFTLILTCISLVIGLVEARDSLSKANITLENENEILETIKVVALSNVMDILDFNSKIRIQQVLLSILCLMNIIIKLKHLLGMVKQANKYITQIS